MKKIYLFAATLFLLICHVNTCLAQTGFEPVINGMINDAVNSSMSKGQVDKISNTLSKTADVYYSTKSSAVETQILLSGTVTQETRKTAKRSKILDILKKIETAFLDASLNNNNHR